MRLNVKYVWALNQLILIFNMNEYFLWKSTKIQNKTLQKQFVRMERDRIAEIVLRNSDSLGF